MTMPVSRFAGMAGGVAGALAVAAGAFGSHALRARLDADALRLWQIAVDYQFWHALALLAVALLPFASRGSRVAAIAFGVGIVLFSGSLYALALGAPRMVGAITPFGGVAFLVGWTALIVAFARRR